MLSPNHVITKDTKSWTYCSYVRCLTLIAQVWGRMPCPSNRRNSLPCTHLEPSDKGRASKGFDCLPYVVWLVSLIYMEWFFGQTSARCVGGLVRVATNTNQYWSEVVMNDILLSPVIYGGLKIKYKGVKHNIFIFYLFSAWRSFATPLLLIKVFLSIGIKLNIKYMFFFLVIFVSSKPFLVRKINSS